MKRIVLFSDIQNNANLREVIKSIFPKEMKNKKMLFMPAGGGVNRKYRHYYIKWENFSAQNGASFQLVNNSIPPEEDKKLAVEIKKIHTSNILVISGGDPFKLLYYLRRTGMDEEIKNFIQKDNNILAGYSAGAMVLTPTIAITTMKVTNQEGKRVPIYEVREKSIHPGLKNDLTGLHLVNFEIVPHFEDKYAGDVELYRKKTRNEVRTCTDDEFYIVEK